MAWRNYQMSCRNIFSWNTSFDMPNCTDECKELAKELGMNPIGRHLKCCRCDRGDRKCIHERRNVGFFCNIDFNNGMECQNNEKMCGNSTRGMMEGEMEMEEPRGIQQGREDQNQREREEPDNDNQNKECDMNQGPESRSDGMEPRDGFGKTCYAV